MSVPSTVRALDAGAILFREVARTARQGRTYGVRVLFSGTLIGVVLISLGFGSRAAAWFGGVDTASYGSMGRSLFVGFAAIQVFVSMVLAPMMVARAVIEEREERTIDVLVLTRLTPAQILFAKVASTLLWLITIVLGAMPVLAVVTSLGGVSIVEVVAVTLDAIAALVVLGVLGGFFALFTRSQVLATGAALLWAIPVFLVLPWLYALGVAAVAGATHLSPLYGTAARGWAALLPVLAFAPVAVRGLRLGSRVFALRSATATYSRLFHRETWGQKAWLIEGAVVLVAGASALPVAVVGSWMALAGSSAGAQGMVTTAIQVAANLVVWVWAVMFVSWATWIYLRLGAEWIVSIEGVLSPAGRARSRGIGTTPQIGGNPVLWRESRLRAFAVWGMFLAFWIIAMWGVFQSMMWVVPGALLFLGAINAGLAWLGAAWLISTSIERERREGTLELLMTTTMPARHVVLGKLAAGLFPTSPFLLVSLPLVVLGLPHADLLQVDWTGSGSSELWTVLVRGGFVAGWVVAFWLFVACFSLALSVRVRRPRAAHAVNLAVPTALVVVPWMLHTAFQSVTPIRVLARAAAPIVAIRGPWWEPSLATACLLTASLALVVVSSFRMRAWVAAGME